MLKFIQLLIFLGIFVLVSGEIVVRTFKLTNDIPQREIDENHIQKYIPGQVGFWNQGEFRFEINKYGWPGKLPNSFDNLITVIGDSYIENFMNPPECQQKIFLEKLNPNRNIFEVGRSGISFIETLEIANQLDSLNPDFQLLYLSDNDFKESISNIAFFSDRFQVNVETMKKKPGILLSPRLKKILYNWKFMYKLYVKFAVLFNPVEKKIIQKEKEIDPELYKKLLQFVKDNYNLDKIYFVLHPNFDDQLLNLLQAMNYQFLSLDDSKDSTWTFPKDKHWTCYGHEQVAKQVSKLLIVD